MLWRVLRSPQGLQELVIMNCMTLFFLSKLKLGVNDSSPDLCMNAYGLTYPSPSLLSNLSFGIIIRVESEAFQAS